MLVRSIALMARCSRYNCILSVFAEKKYADTKGVILRTDNTMAQSKRANGQAMIYQIQTQITEDWEPRTPLKIGVNSGAPEGLTVL